MKVEARECVDKNEVFGEFQKLVHQAQKDAFNQDEKDGLQQAIIILQNILF